ncbi:MAG: polysaccharide deacetylase family protein [Acidimicrobiales bacterium]
MHTPTTYVTTSWDDGHELDLRLASQLASHGVAGTFYVAPQCREIPEAKRLGPESLRELAAAFEIGAHTLTHPRLPTLSPAEARREIVDGKVALEDVIGRPVTSFCYPYGAYADEHPAMVRSVGFTLARTVERFCTEPPGDLFEMGTTIHAYRHLVDGGQIRRRARSLRHASGMWRNWDLLGRELFKEVRASGGVFHLWGHSWEIAAHDDWSRLNTVLEEISSHEDARFVTNGELAGMVGGSR